jgi:hypothetical protein
MDEKSDQSLQCLLEACITERHLSSGQKSKEDRSCNTFCRGGFLTLHDLKEILTYNRVKGQLGLDFPSDQGDEKITFTEAILSRGLKLYAILLCIREAPRIKPLLLDDKVDDDIFKYKADAEEILSFFCTKEELSEYPTMRPIVDLFYEAQWVVPPMLPRIDDIEFPAQHFRFPFEKIGEQIASGAYGQVYSMVVAPGFLGQAGLHFYRGRISIWGPDANP